MAALIDGLIGYWKGDENTGTTAADSTPSGSTMTFNSANWGTGKINSGMSFDSSHNMSGTFNNAPLASSPRSVSLWVFGGTFGANDTVFGWGAASNTNAFQLQINTSSTIHFSGWNDDADWTVSLSTTTWYHMVLVYNGATIVQLYLNSVPQGEKTLAGGALNTTTATLKFGIAVNGGGAATGMSIDEVGIWNRQLSNIEAIKLYNSGLGIQYPFATNPPENMFRSIAVGNGMSRSEGAT